MHRCTTLAYLLFCTLTASAAAAGSISRSTLQQYSAPPKGQPPNPLALKDGAIVSSTTGASSIHLKAAVWGGPTSEPFSSFVHASRPEGTGNSSISRALVSAAYYLRKQGYNAVYLPFCFSDLRDATTSSSSSSSSAGQQQHQQQQQGGKQQCEQLCMTCLLAPGGSTAGKPAAGRSSTLKSGGDSRTCQSVLPITTTLDRYLWSAQWFLANGLYVFMASSSNGGSGGGKANPQTPAEAAAAWAGLWRAVVALPDFEAAVKGRVMLQLALDPAGQRWEPTTSSNGKNTAGLQETYLATMDAIDHVRPGAALFILQGPQQQGPAGSSPVQWGNGFSVDQGLLRLGASDPTPLFKALKDQPYRNQVILSQRVWGPQPLSSSTTHASATAASPAPAAATAEASDEQPSADGATRVKVLDNAFHQLSKRGFCVSEDSCLKFPVVVMQQQEKGPAMQDQEVAEDVQLFADFVLSQQSSKAGADDEVATGHWYHWDTTAGADTAPQSPPTQPQGTRSVRPNTDTAAASTTAGRGTDKASPGEVLTFVYAADSDGEDGESFSVRELHADGGF